MAILENRDRRGCDWGGVESFGDTLFDLGSGDMGVHFIIMKLKILVQSMCVFAQCKFHGNMDWTKIFLFFSALSLASST